MKMSEDCNNSLWKTEEAHSKHDLHTVNTSGRQKEFESDDTTKTSEGPRPFETSKVVIRGGEQSNKKQRLTLKNRKVRKRGFIGGDEAKLKDAQTKINKGNFRDKKVVQSPSETKPLDSEQKVKTVRQIPKNSTSLKSKQNSPKKFKGNKSADWKCHQESR